MKKIITFIMIFTVILPIKVFAVESTSDNVSLSTCVDGNSARFMLGLGEIKVKFLGIDTEEKIKDKDTDEINETFVSDYVCEMLTNAKKITIEYDPNVEKEDKYGRIQAWVFVDGELLQENLVMNGYAKVMYLNEDYLYTEKIKNAQNYAREEKLGIWEEEVIEVASKDSEKVKEEKKSKGIFETIFDFIGGLFSKLLKFIDDIISEIL